MKRNPNLARLSGTYLFREMQRYKREYLSRNPRANVISLGVGDTSQPIPASVLAAFIRSAERLGDAATYSGYGPENGLELLRKEIANTLYADRVAAEEVYISDGTKCDIGRLMFLFGPQASLAVQDPTYPAYVDIGILAGLQRIEYLPCTPENGFFPNLENAPRTDVIAFCSPNNPTGAAATRQQLTSLVAFARKNRSIILYDAAYAAYICDPDLPRSIFEIEGAREVAIELGSFSKLAGFTGVRLGWTVVPRELTFDDGTSVAQDWSRIISTVFNGASNLAQPGGVAVLDRSGMLQVKRLVSEYMRNVSLLRSVLQGRACTVYGGGNAPYLWVHFPGRRSWEIFQEMLERRQLVTTPGIGFGPSGEGFIRLTAFGTREQVEIAVQRLSANPPL